MIGRSVGNSLARIPLYARLPLRVVSSQCVVTVPQRSYATPGRPRPTVGEPSRPVKRAVKRAAKKDTTNDPASKEVKAKAKTAAAKEKTAKKKKATPKKAAKKKTAPKPKKVLTEEQQQAKAARRVKDEIKQLKQTALKPPTTRGTLVAWHILLKEQMKGDHEPVSSAKSRVISERYKALSPAELEHYNHLAHTQNESKRAEYKRWVESHTPEQIRLANNARAQLRRRLKAELKGKGQHKYSNIHDERSVKRPLNAYMLFSMNRQSSGDFQNIKVIDRVKLIAQEWRVLDESEKKKYKELHSADASRYSDEHASVFGRAPPNLNIEGDAPRTVAAAA